MSKSKLIASVIVCALLLLACAALGFWSQASYKAQKARMEHLEEGLEEAELVLGKTKGQLQNLNRQNASLAGKNKGLNAEILSLKEGIAGIQKAKDALADETQRISSEKKRLQSRLNKVVLAAREQVILKEREFEREFREKVDSEKEKFLTQKKVLTGQIETQEAMLKNLARKNEGLLGELTAAQELLGKLQKEKELLEENERLSAELNKNKKTLGGLQKEKEKLTRQFEQNENRFKKETVRFHYNLALTYDESRRYKEALAEYKKALEVAPDDPDIHYNLAVLYDEHIYDDKKAIEHYRTYLKLRPDAQDADKVVYWITKAEEELKFE